MKTAVYRRQSFQPVSPPVVRLVTLSQSRCFRFPFCQHITCGDEDEDDDSHFLKLRIHLSVKTFNPFQRNLFAAFVLCEIFLVAAMVSLGIAMGMACRGMPVQMAMECVGVSIELDPAALHAVDFFGGPGQKIIFVRDDDHADVEMI
jgi:hypothetical protein